MHPLPHETKKKIPFTQSTFLLMLLDLKLKLNFKKLQAFHSTRKKRASPEMTSPEVSRASNVPLENDLWVDREKKHC